MITNIGLRRKRKRPIKKNRYRRLSSTYL